MKRYDDLLWTEREQIKMTYTFWKKNKVDKVQGTLQMLDD